MGLAGATAAKGLAENKWTPLVIGGIVVVVVAVAYFGIARPIMCKVGILTCKAREEKDRLIQKIVRFEGFDPNYYNPNYKTIDPTRAKILADQVADSTAWYGDDEEAIYAILREAGSKDNLSFISKQFNIRHEQSMGEYITSRIHGDEEIKTIWNILETY